MKCIYKIENKENGKFYIGSSLNFEKRKSRHLRDLKQGKHHNIYLQRAWNKYGEEKFEFIIVEECVECRDVEQKILDILDWSKCYNISATASGGDFIKNHPNREEIIQKAAERLKSAKRPEPRFGKDNGNWKGGHRFFCQCGTKIQETNTSCIKCSDKTGENNPFYGKHHSQETIDLLSKQRQGVYKGNQEVPVIIENQEYTSVSKAARDLGVVAGTILFRIKSKNPKFKNYFYKTLTTIETTE